MLIQSNGNTLTDQVAAGTVTGNGTPVTQNTSTTSATTPTTTPASDSTLTPATKSPTVVSNANIVNDTIPAIQSKYNALASDSSVGTTNPQAAATTGTTSNTGDTSGSDYISQYNDLLNESGATSADAQDPTSTLLGSLSGRGDRLFNNTIQSIQQQGKADQALTQFGQGKQDQEATNLLLRTGASRTGSGPALMGSLNTSHLLALHKMQADENNQILQAQQAMLDKDYKTADALIASAKDTRTEKQALAGKVFDQMAADTQAKQTAQAKIQADVNQIAQDAAKNGATPEQLDQITSAQNVGDAVKAAGDSLQTGTGTVGEYLYYKRDAAAHGQTPLTYNEYANMDANRKRSVVNVGGGSGGVGGTTTDENGNVIQTGNYDALTIGRYNRAVNAATSVLQKNPTFKNIIGSSAYLDRIEAASQNPGSVGDQELLDAFTQLNTGGNRVTEAQVHLITGNQSLADAISKWQNKLKSGGALSNQQRQEMTTLAQDVYKKYQASYAPLYKDATDRLQAQGVPKQFWNIPSPDTLSRAVGDSSGGNTGAGVVSNEDQARKSVVSYAAAHPDKEPIVQSLAGVVQPNLGRAYTWSEIQQIIGAQ